VHLEDFLIVLFAYICVLSHINFTKSREIRAPANGRWLAARLISNNDHQDLQLYTHPINIDNVFLAERGTRFAGGSNTSSDSSHC